ncbi:unnamed protein product [Tuber aestivum]|uniref:40S ribosomal protein S21 n=1 Tax=Tuber aestivum TaxID=59557 RepID=A0A292PYG3_9PEZI|nr:unnamed protein product [Tuber aestivum]
MENDKGELSFPQNQSLLHPANQPTNKFANKIATNRIIKAKDHASVQISVGKVDETGRYIHGENTTYALCGFVRSMGESDDALNRLAQRDGLLKNVWSASRQH